VTALDRPRKVAISAEARPLGEYVADLRIRFHHDMETEALRVAMDLKDIEHLQQHLVNVHQALTDRQLADAICGDCETCQNVRMVDREKSNGRVSPRGFHCPVCKPKLDAAREVLKHGLEVRL
jgi:hypothetical protein